MSVTRIGQLIRTCFQVYNWYCKKRWKPYPSTLYVTITTISALKVDSKPQQRSCTPLQPEIGSNSSVKSLALFNNGDDEVDFNNPDTSSATYRLVCLSIQSSTSYNLSTQLTDFSMYVE